MVRWVLFPTFSALAGALAALGAAFLAMGGLELEAAMIVAPMAVAGAIGCVMPGPVWLSAPLAPVLGGTAFCGLFAAFRRFTRKTSDTDPFEVLEKLLTSEFEWMIAIGVASVALSVAHRIRRRGVKPGWVAYAVAAAVISLLGWAPMRGRDATFMLLLGPALAFTCGLAMELALRINGAPSAAPAEGR